MKEGGVKELDRIFNHDQNSKIIQIEVVFLIILHVVVTFHLLTDNTFTVVMADKIDGPVSAILEGINVFCTSTTRKTSVSECM